MKHELKHLRNILCRCQIAWHLLTVVGEQVRPCLLHISKNKQFIVSSYSEYWIAAHWNTRHCIRIGHPPYKELTIDLQSKFLFSSNLFLIQKTLKVAIFSVIDEKLCLNSWHLKRVQWLFSFFNAIINPIQGPKRLPYQFSPCNFYKRRN